MKRNPEDTDGIGAVKPVKVKKRKKHRHREQEAENNSSIHQSVETRVSKLPSKQKVSCQTYSSNDTPESRLELLERITRDLADGPESIRELTKHSSLEVASAAVELARAFARLKAPPQSFSEGDNQSKQANPPEIPPIKNEALEAATFTHQSATHKKVSSTGHTSYDRLEILGDAYIEIIATRLIWNRFPNMPTGRLSQIREILVKNETLARFSERFGFDKRVKASFNIRTEQPRIWPKVKGDIFEAYVAAVILSDPVNGFNVAEDWLEYLWTPLLADVQPDNHTLNYKEALAKKVMGKGTKINYIDESPPISRKGGMETYFIGVYLTGWGWNDQHLGSGTGLSKSVAGNAAAKQALENRPLIDEIHNAKKAFYEKTKAEREDVLSAQDTA